MAKKKIGQVVTRPGRLPSDPPINIPIPEDLMTVPGIPLRQNEVDFYSGNIRSKARISIIVPIASGP
jgi:hypothetical protein